MKLKAATAFNAVLTILIAFCLIAAAVWIGKWVDQTRVLREVIERLSAETRIAEVLVTKSEYDEGTRKVLTTIKFLEFDHAGEPLEPKYFTFHGNTIQFQSLVVRFDDRFVKAGDKLKGKSAYLFMKAFVLDGKETQSFDITETDSAPRGYSSSGKISEFESRLWTDFWDYALDPAKRERAGIKNVQLEAPGSIFVPGTIYTLRIEHDGGLRIDTQPIPAVLKGESL